MHFLSAFWHGLESGLYVCFTGLGLFVAVEHKVKDIVDIFLCSN